jgi:filamentous hemagglutinin family protein
MVERSESILIRQPKQLLLLMALGVVLGSSASILATSAQAQIIPDDTLGEERSTLQQDFNVRGQPADQIEGGAQRGGNLFHSFSTFNVEEGERLYFANPTGVETILTRVTGSDPSNILGTLGVDGAANLFLLNPHGILFGPNATLDVQGSFVATTANTIELGEDGQFSATTPETSTLLSVNPSAFFFNALEPPGEIINRSTTGLAVPEGRSLVLLGGLVRLADGSRLSASGGRIELAGLSSPGVISLGSDRETLSLQFPAGSLLADVTVDNAIAEVGGNQSGEIVVHANQFTALNGGQLTAVSFGDSDAGRITINANRFNATGQGTGLFTRTFPNTVANAGDILITAASFSLSDGALLDTRTSGQGNAGNIFIDVQDYLSLGQTSFNGELSSAVISSVDPGAIGEGGRIAISTGSLAVTNGSQLISASSGQGNAGDITINAREQVSFDGESSIAISNIGPGGIGNGGRIEISAGTLSLTDGGRFITTSGRGDSGDIVINAREQVLVNGGSSETGLFTANAPNVVNTVTNAGDILITTASFSLFDGALLDARTSGQGDAGNIVINARERISLGRMSRSNESSSAVISSVDPGATGEGGTIRLSTSSLAVANGSQLISASSGQGNAGDIVITARDRVSFESSGAFSSIGPGGIGEGGRIDISTGSLSITDDSQLTSASSGQGNAGDIAINARDRVSFSESSGAISSIGPGGVGEGGRIEISTGSLSTTDGSQLISASSGQGNAGGIIINARDRISFDGLSINRGVVNSSAAVSSIGVGGIGNGGRVQLSASTLSLTNGGQLITASSGQGDAGDIIINARDRISFDGGSINRGSFTPSAAFSSIGAPGIGDGGRIQLSTGSLAISNGGEIITQSLGRGNAGNIAINATGPLTIEEGSINTTADRASGGNIEVQAQGVQLSGDSNITSFVQRGEGRGGSINIRANSIAILDDSDILAFSVDGTGGRINLDTPAFLSENASSSAENTVPNRSALNALARNNQVDINATGGVQSGTITLPDAVFLQDDLTELPTNFINTETLVATSCVQRRRSQNNSFIVTGGGGLPERPGDLETSLYPTGEVQSIPGDRARSDADAAPPWQLGDPIVEPQGAYQLENGQLVMSRECVH